MVSYKYIRHQLIDGIHVATFTTDMLHAEAVHEVRNLDQLGKIGALVIDFRNIRHLVSGSLYPEHCPFGPVLKLQKEMKAAGQQLVLCEMDSDLRNVFRTIRFDHLFEIHADIDTALNAINPGASKFRPLTVQERSKVAAVAFAFWFIFTGIFAIIFACGEPLEPLRKYPLDPEGWVVVRNPGGAVIRDANLWDMIKAKYFVLLFLGGYAAVILTSAVIFVLGVLGKRNRLTTWVLRELSAKNSFRLSK